MRISHEMPSQTVKEPSKETNLLGSQFVSIGVFSDDFATVDVREELCYHSRPKKQNSEILYNERIVSTVFSCRNEDREECAEECNNDGYRYHQ